MSSDPRRWLALFTNYLMFLSSGFLFFLLPPLIPELKASFQLNDLAIGWLQGMYAIPAVLFALVGGAALDRWDTRRTGVVSALLILSGSLLFNFGIHYALMMAGRFILGVGCILINLVAGKMITLWFRDRQRGLAMSILHTAWPIAAIVAFSSFFALGQWLGWQGTTLVLNAFVALTVLGFILLAPRDPEAGDQPQPAATPLPTANSNGILARISRRLASFPKDLWLMAFVWFCFTVSTASLFTFGSAFLNARGLDYGAASFTIGLIMWTATPGSLLAGWLIDRFGRIRSYIILPALVVALCLFGLLTRFPPAPLILVAGILAGFLPVAVYAIPGQVVQPARLGVAFGVILTFSNLGNVVGPVAVGWLNTALGTREPGMLLIAGAFAVCVVWGLLLGRHSLVREKG
ncbi:MAG TPA: MFS transporter [Acidobacteriota bacterium]|nr:MFS transporter [Acidobacteriota bacterium]